MFSLSEFLRRLRRAWAPPGPALARVAPPTDTAERLRKEVAQLLQAIAELQSAADAIRKEAEREVARITDEARQEADRRVREAGEAAPAARAEAAEQERKRVDAEIERITRSGEAEVVRIQSVSGDRLSELVAAVRRCVLAGAGT